MMTHKTNGFSLLEVLIAIAIASMLSIILFQSFNQINHSVFSLDKSIDIQTKATIAAWQMEKDISGACIPPRFISEQGTSDAEKAQEKTKPLTHIFYGTSKEIKDNNKNLQLLTFITNNPLQAYWSASTGAAKPRLVRVMYQLKPDSTNNKNKQPSYVLVRQESPILDFDEFKNSDNQKIREYELISGIKQLSCAYITAPASQKKEQKDEKNKEKKEQKDEKKSEPIAYKTLDEWNPSINSGRAGKEEKNQHDKNKEPEPIIPHFVDITLIVWNNQQKSDKTFKFTIPIAPDIQYLPQQETKETKKIDTKKTEGEETGEKQTGTEQIGAGQVSAKIAEIGRLDVTGDEFAHPSINSGRTAFNTSQNKGAKIANRSNPSINSQLRQGYDGQAGRTGHTRRHSMRNRSAQLPTKSGAA